MTDQPAEPMPVIDAEPKAEKESKMKKILAKMKAGVQLLIRKISEYPGTALLIAIASHAARTVF